LGSAHTADALNALTTTAAVRFVRQEALPPGEPYERFIAETGQVPTRDNLHDFFNGLAWLRYPQAKAQLNRIQASAIATGGVGRVRGPVRDAATVFDENGAVFIAPDVLWNALQARDWAALFITHREAWRTARLELFGHALLEKLVSPRKSIVAHVLHRPLAIERISTEVQANELPTDVWLARHLSAERLATKPFAPLPVLGVPGWWPANESPTFYDDPLVFRPRRTTPVD
jgi:hypothetical protein